MAGTDEARRENLRYLAVVHGQDIFATAHPSLTQPNVSKIINKKGRSLKDGEARAIEGTLRIPHGWMDKEGYVEHGSPLIKRFQKLSEDQRNLFDEMCRFMAQGSEGRKATLRDVLRKKLPSRR